MTANKMTANKMPANKILVIQTAFPGDAILTLPMIQELKRKYSDAVIDVLCIPQTKDIFNSNPAVNTAIVMDKRGEHRSLLSIIRLASLLRANEYDRIYSPHRSFRTSLLVAFSAVKETTGFDIASMSWIYKRTIKYRPEVHEVRRNLNLIGAEYGEDNWKVMPEINAGGAAIEKVNGYLLKHRVIGRIAAVATGSVWNTKKYPPEGYALVIKYLRDKGYTVLVIGSPSEREECQRLIEMTGEAGVICAAGEFTIPETIELLKRCRMVICNDSAPTHFAMCAGIPAITIYCSTVPSFGFYPYNEKSVYLSYDELECKPCGIHGHRQCPIGTFDCAYRLDVNLIYREIDKFD